MEICAFVLGIISIILVFVPVVRYIAFIPALIAIILGIISMIKMKKEGKFSGFGLAGILTGIGSLILFIIRIVIIVVGIIVLGVSGLAVSNELSSENKNNTLTVTSNYTIKDIEEKFISNSKKYNIDEIDFTNISEFNKLLSYVDNMVGKNNYKIESIYPVSLKYHKSYVVKIILNEYMNAYTNWGGSDVSNPYKVMISMDSDNGEIKNFYYTFKLALKYKEDVKKEISGLNNNYECLVDYNTLLNYSAEALKVNQNSTWSDALKNLTAMSNRPTLYLVADSTHSIEELEQFVKNNNSIFKKYYAQSVNVIQLKENKKITNYDSFNQYNDLINDKKAVKIEY